MHNHRPASPPTPQDRLLRDSLHGVPFIRLHDRHRKVVETTWRKTGALSHCSTCGTLWPCEVGLALAIIDSLLSTS
jgi:hypothetical protein